MKKSTNIPRRTNETVAKTLDEMMNCYKGIIEKTNDEMQKLKLTEYAYGMKVAYDMLTNRGFFEDMYDIYVINHEEL